MKQGEAILVQGLVEQGAGQIQVLCILPVLAVLQGPPALRHAQEVLQCPHVPRLAGCEQGIAELGPRVSCEGGTAEESDATGPFGCQGRAVLGAEQKTNTVLFKASS